MKKELSKDLKQNLDVMMKATMFQRTLVTYMNTINLNTGEVQELKKRFEEVDTD